MIYYVIYVLAIVCANLSVATFGPWVSPLNSFFFIGLDLTLRDKIHEKNRNNVKVVIILIVVAGIISYLLNPASGRIAVASAISFIIAGFVDTVIYQKYIKGKWMIKSNASNTGGALADSILFPTIAFGSIMPMIILLQFTAKVFGGFIWSLIIKSRVKAWDGV